MGSDAVDQGLEQPADLTQPVGQRRAAELDTFAGVDLRLAVEMR
jgi:hypothetical protein